MYLIIYIAIGVALALFIFANIDLIFQIFFDLSKALIFIALLCIGLFFALYVGPQILGMALGSVIFWGPPMALIGLYIALALSLDWLIKRRRKTHLKRLRNILVTIRDAKLRLDVETTKELAKK